MSLRFIKGIENYRRETDCPTVITIGTFDGIHRGHQEIFKHISSLSAKNGYEPILITFNPHPKVVVSPEKILLLLTTLEEKEIFIPHFFDGTVLTLEFDDNLKEMSADAFVREILIEKMGAKKVIVGHNHAFGKNRSGNISELRKLGEKYNFDVEVVGPVMYKKEAISSSRIRKAMLNNEYGEAINMLGHDYAISGIVERGIGLGQRFGYPTANVRYSSRKLLPCEGVYACWAQIDDMKKYGMLFIGKNHFNPQERISVEANLFDFNQDIYGKNILVYPTHYIRSNQKYDTTDKLVEQISLDKKKVFDILNEEKKNVNEQTAKSSNYFCNPSS